LLGSLFGKKQKKGSYFTSEYQKIPHNATHWKNYDFSYKPNNTFLMIFMYCRDNRHNRRKDKERLNKGNCKYNTMDRLRALVKGTHGKRLTYKMLTQGI
jgi:hypothetical protein